MSSSDPNLWPCSALAFTDPAITISTQKYCGILWDVSTTIERKHSNKGCLHVSRKHVHSYGSHCLEYPALHGLVSAGPSPIPSESCTLLLPCAYLPEEGTNGPLRKVKLRHKGHSGAVVWSAAYGVLWRRTHWFLCQWDACLIPMVVYCFCSFTQNNPEITSVEYSL